jgi:hypothetical protein
MRSHRLFGEGKAIVQLVLPYGWVSRMNALANQHGVNRSALIREALQRVYFAGSDEVKQGEANSTPGDGLTGASAQECHPADGESAGGAQGPAEEPARGSVARRADQPESAERRARPAS